MALLLCVHVLLISHDELLAIVIGQAVGTGTLLHELVVVTGQQLLVALLGGLGSGLHGLLLGRRLVATGHERIKE